MINKGGLKFRKVVFSTEKRVEDRFKFPKAILSYSIYLLSFTAVIYFVFISGIFKIENISVENVKSAEIEDYVNMTLRGKNILLMLPGRYLRELAEEFPVLEEARIVRGLPSTVRVTVDEREQKFVWCNKSDCYEVDNNGYVFEKTNDTKKAIVLRDLNNVKVNQLEQVASKKFIKFFIVALDKIKETGVVVSEAQIEQTTFKVDFVTKDGWKIIMDTGGSLENQIYSLKQVIETNKSDIKEYVDVRVEGVAFVK